MTMDRYNDQDLLPRHSVVQKSVLKLFDDAEIINHLRVQSRDLSTDQIKYYMDVATQWVQDQLGKTLLTMTRETVVYNNRFVLPYGPVLWNASSQNKDIITKVIYGKKELEPHEYKVRMVGDSVEIQVPFSWKERALTVQYVAGYGDAGAVPTPLKHAVMGTIEYLYNNNGNLEVLEAATAPWLQGCRTYRLF
jgi:hypothetical protein